MIIRESILVSDVYLFVQKILIRVDDFKGDNSWESFMRQIKKLDFYFNDESCISVALGVKNQSTVW